MNALEILLFLVVPVLIFPLMLGAVIRSTRRSHDEEDRKREAILRPRQRWARGHEEPGDWS